MYGLVQKLGGCACRCPCIPATTCALYIAQCTPAQPDKSALSCVHSQKVASAPSSMQVPALLALVLVPSSSPTTLGPALVARAIRRAWEQTLSQVDLRELGQYHPHSGESA